METVSRRRFLQGSATGLAVSGLGAYALRAQDWARQAVDKSPRKREWVTVKHGNRSVESVVAYPQTQGKAPGIVVIHDYLRDVAQYVIEFLLRLRIHRLLLFAPKSVRETGKRQNMADLPFPRRAAPILSLLYFPQE